MTRCEQCWGLARNGTSKVSHSCAGTFRAVSDWLINIRWPTREWEWNLSDRYGNNQSRRYDGDKRVLGMAGGCPHRSRASDRGIIGYNWDWGAHERRAQYVSRFKLAITGKHCKRDALTAAHCG